ncbi:efflux RND transporter permease subunit [Maricaulis parjimensis]|uniref:efflux RND transporter permease subunit n=1 Tax=Maricaulis parjimensis TaxID=144023 RepID=UPI00193ABFDC|nr:efflux RND transporter permease subunit [Maricaulis parjimensis]
MSLERNDLPALAVKRPVLVAVLNLLIIIGGLAALFGVEVRELPDVDRPVVSVTAQFPGAAPETVDAEVTAILEGAVARVSGVREIDAQSEENGSRVRIEFNPGVDLDSAAADVREAVSRVTRDLPDRVEQIRVVKADDNAQPIVRLAVMSDTLDEESLTALVENDIVPEFLSIEGVASVDLSGDRQRLLRVVMDPLRLSRFGLTVGDVADALAQAPFDVPVGSFRSDEQQLIVRAEATAATPERVKEVIVSGTTRVGDVADAYFAPADASSFVRLDGQSIIALGIVRQAQSNTMSISQGVGDVVDRLNARFDEVTIRTTSDDAVFIEGSVREVLTSLVITIIIVVATIWLFFARFRASLIPSTAIPAALIGALAGIWVLGFSINLLTLLALVLATGLIVDDAIVVIENIQRLQKKGLGRRAAAVLGTRQVFFAVVATTAVLVSVFVPISFLPSTAGRLFREFGFVLALAVVISSFVALSIVPALAARLWLRSEGSAPGLLERIGLSVSAVYARILGWTLNHPWLSAGVMALAALGAVAAYMSLEQELVPQEDRGRIYVFATGPDGVGLEFMERQADYVEAILQPYLDNGEITSLETIIGRWDPNRISVTATLADWSERDRSQQDIINELRRPLSDIPGVRASVFGRGSLDVRGRSRGGIQIALTGRDYSEIYEAALLMEREIDTNSRMFANPSISYQPTQPQLSIQIDRRRAADLGVPLSELSMTLRVMVGGDELVDLNVGDQSIPIFLESTNDAIDDPSDLQNLYVRSTSGELIPISTLTTIVEEGVAAELNRTEQRRSIELEADIAAGVALADAVAEMNRLADELLPPGIEIIMQGEARTLNETSRDMTITYLFALVIVFLVLAAQFESVTSPVVVMLTVPFGLAAAVYALFLTGVSLNIFSQIGLVMLIGLMAKNGILVVEFADQLRAEGKSVRQAIEEAAIIRLRPITMTLISTILGALPLILSSGAGAEARASIGWTVFGGLALSGLFTLFLTPVIYLGIARFGKPRSVNLAELEAELERAEADPETGHPAE